MNCRLKTRTFVHAYKTAFTCVRQVCVTETFAAGARQFASNNNCKMTDTAAEKSTWRDSINKKGAFVRADSDFRKFVTGKCIVSIFLHVHADSVHQGNFADRRIVTQHNVGI